MRKDLGAEPNERGIYIGSLEGTAGSFWPVVDESGEIHLQTAVTTDASSVTISVVIDITSRLVALSMADLDKVSDFIETLKASSIGNVSDAMASALASEATLAKYWDTPEEDAAWADLLEETL